MGEEESRAWQRGANSDASLRPFGKCQDFITSNYHNLLRSPWETPTFPHWRQRQGPRPRVQHALLWQVVIMTKSICPVLVFRHFELWPVMSLVTTKQRCPSLVSASLHAKLKTVNHFSRNRSMDDDLEGRAREREAPSAERGFPNTLLFLRKI